jgi:IMP dehydrogenase
MAQIITEVSRTFDEFLLLPNRTRTHCVPSAVELRTPLVRHRVGEAPEFELAVPFSSAIMQAVSSPELAVALGRAGGLGFLHHSRPVDAQAADVREVRRRLDVTSGGTGDRAGDGPTPRPPVAAGVNTHDYRERIPALVAAGADVLCFDSSDGYTDWQAQALGWAAEHFPHTPVGGGNVVDGGAFEFLAEAGAAFVKVGVGGGSICSTRRQKAIGRGQADAVLDVAAARDTYLTRTGQYVPLCSDGGLAHDQHITLALAMGADFVMMGRWFARFDEAPGARIDTPEGPMKEYWAEGSNRARNWQRYDQGGDAGSGSAADGATGSATGLLFEEGVDGHVPAAGPLASGLAASLAKLRATMVSCGAVSLSEFRSGARLAVATGATLGEGHPSVRLADPK